MHIQHFIGVTVNCPRQQVMYENGNKNFKQPKTCKWLIDRKKNLWPFMAHMRLFAKAFGKFRPISSAHTVKICEKKKYRIKADQQKQKTVRGIWSRTLSEETSWGLTQRLVPPQSWGMDLESCRLAIFSHRVEWILHHPLSQHGNPSSVSPVLTTQPLHGEGLYTDESLTDWL